MKLTYIDARETEDFRFRKVVGVMPANCHRLALPKSFQGSYWLLVNEQQHSEYWGQLSNDFSDVSMPRISISKQLSDQHQQQ